MSDTAVQPSEHLVQLLIQHQPQLRGFINTLLGNHAHCDDVLQKTNLTLLRKAADFRPDAKFQPWALTVARYEVLAFLRDHRRDRLVFSPLVSEAMADSVEGMLEDVSERQTLLRECIEKLPEKSRHLIHQRYVEEHSISRISESLRRSANGVYSLLYRVRQMLAECIDGKQSESGEVKHLT